MQIEINNEIFSIICVYCQYKSVNIKLNVPLQSQGHMMAVYLPIGLTSAPCTYSHDDKM